MRLLTGLLTVLVTAFSMPVLWAGGSGFNVVVVVNQNSTNSVQLGNAYCEQRGVPPQNVFRMTNWAGGAKDWNRSDFESCLRNPLLAMLAGRGLTNQAEYALLSMDIPYRVWDGPSANSTTATLFCGFKTNTAPPVGCLPASCSLPDASANSYVFSERPFRDAPPDTAPTNSFLAMMLTGDTLAGAGTILSRGVASDSTFPTQKVYLAKTTDTARNVRFLEFDNAMLDTRIRGHHSLVWTNTNSTSFTNLLGLMTGLAGLSLPGNAFVPGAMGDSLTSFAGAIAPGDSAGQTTLLAFLHAGAAGSYGTIIEPCNYLQKFPNPLNYFYQYRGFSLAECYYQSLQNPYQGLLVGEPLAAPFARPGAADWSTLANGSVLSGRATLNVTFSAATNLPLAQVDLFLDGTFLRTLTNLPPAQGNLLSVTLNGANVSYLAPTNATVASVTGGLADALNAQSNATRVLAYATGDRLELHSLDVLAPGSNVTLSAGTDIGTAAQLTTLLTPARPTFLDSTATGYLSLLASNTPVVGDWLQLAFTKTNGASVTVNITNSAAGTTIATLLQNLFNLVNANPDLQAADGVLAAEFGDATWCGIVAAQMTLYARSPGWPAAQIQVTFTASTNLLVLPSGINRLEENLTDLRPRNHLYVSSGAASLPASFVLDTTSLPDGFHQLAAVAYEGSSVRTQTRIARTVRIQNTSLTATFTSLLVGTNTTLDTPLQFAVAANAPNIASIELFSTGGAVGVVSNQSSALFTTPSSLLGPGLHPFYALVTDTSGNRYQTETRSIRLIPSFKLTLSGAPLRLSWPAVPGVRYDVLAATNPARSFQTVTTLLAASSLLQWPIPAPTAAASFYRVSLSP